MLVLLAVVLLSGSACTYHGALRDHFYQPSYEHGPKLPFTVAVLVDEHARSVRFAGPMGVKLDFNLYENLRKALQGELETVFKKVSVVQYKSQGKNYDILALVKGDVTSDGGWFIQEYKASVDLTLTSLQDGVELAKESQAKQFQANGWALSLDWEDRICLQFAPFSRCGRDNIGDSIGGSLATVLSNLIHRVAADFQSSGELAAYVRRGSSGPEVVTKTVERTVPFSDVDTLPALRAAPRKNAHALVIGLEKYRGQLPKANFAESDATLMAKYLTHVMGYAEENVAVLLNDQASKSDLEKYLESWLPNRVEPGDTVFVYFSGHGAPNPKTGDGYLVPYDGDPTFLDKTGYSLNRLYQQLAKLPAQEVVVMLDSCFSGAGGRSVIAEGMRPFVVEMKNPLLTNGNTLVLSAGTGLQVASTYTQKNHGLLTYFFLKGLQGEADTNKDGAIALKELFDYLGPQVERVARREFNNEQTPQLLGSAELLSRGVRLVE